MDDFHESPGVGDALASRSVRFFPSPELEFEHVVQPFGRVIFLGVEVEMQHGVGVPFRFEPFDGEALEEGALAEEVGFHRREQQALAEAAGTAQEVRVRGANQLVDQFRFVDVHVVFATKFLETLYADGHLAGEGRWFVHDRCVCFHLREVTKNLLDSSRASGRF